MFQPKVKISQAFAGLLCLLLPLSFTWGRHIHRNH